MPTGVVIEQPQVQIVSLSGPAGASASSGSTPTLATTRAGNILWAATKVVVGPTLMPSGPTDVYTCPAGKEAVLVARRCVNTSISTTHTGYAQIKRSGSTYDIGKSATFSTGGRGVRVQNAWEYSSMSVAHGTLALAEGDTLAYNVTAGGNTTYLTHVIAEYTAGSCITSQWLTSFALGDNTLYTVPAGKIAYLVDGFGEVDGAVGLVGNNHGSTLGFLSYMLPDGASAADQYMASLIMPVSSTISVSTGTVSTIVLATFPNPMQAGARIILNCNTATSNAYAVCNIIEVNA